MYEFKLKKIYFVHVTSLHLNISVEAHQSQSEPVQAGGSVTLNCRVHTGTCEEEHTAYWFKNSRDSEPELIYTHVVREEKCKRKNFTCFYNLSITNLNTSMTGTYYCIVAACGCIFSGDGMKLNESKPNKVEYNNQKPTT